MCKKIAMYLMLQEVTVIYLKEKKICCRHFNSCIMFSFQDWLCVLVTWCRRKFEVHLVRIGWDAKCFVSITEQVGFMCWHQEFTHIASLIWVRGFPRRNLYSFVAKGTSFSVGRLIGFQAHRENSGTTGYALVYSSQQCWSGLVIAREQWLRDIASCDARHVKMIIKILFK